MTAPKLNTEYSKSSNIYCLNCIEIRRLRKMGFNLQLQKSNQLKYTVTESGVAYFYIFLFLDDILVYLI